MTQGYTLLDMAGAVPIIQVLPDGAEIGRVFRPALGIVSDLNVFAHAVALRWNRSTPSGRTGPANCGRCGEAATRGAEL